MGPKQNRAIYMGPTFPCPTPPSTGSYTSNENATDLAASFCRPHCCIVPRGLEILLKLNPTVSIPEWTSPCVNATTIMDGIDVTDGSTTTVSDEMKSAFGSGQLGLGAKLTDAFRSGLENNTEEINAFGTSGSSKFNESTHKLNLTMLTKTDFGVASMKTSYPEMHCIGCPDASNTRTDCKPTVTVTG